MLQYTPLRGGQEVHALSPADLEVLEAEAESLRFDLARAIAALDFGRADKLARSLESRLERGIPQQHQEGGSL